MDGINWQAWRFFVTTAECGSLNRAAEKLAVSQSTLSRQLVALERSLGQSLFNRSTQGISLTEFGASLLEEAQLMQDSAHRLHRLAAGGSEVLSGRLRLSANQILAQYYLPNILPEFMELYPEISLEIEVSNQASNIDKRDADIAVRMFRPTQLDLVARHLFDISLGFFASRSYLDSVTRPDSLRQLFGLRVLGYDRDKQLEQGATALGWDISNEDFLFRCDFMPIQIELARNGAGVVITHRELARRLQLQELSINVSIPDLPVYLVCHRDVQHNRKIQVMLDFLAMRLPTALRDTA